MFWNDAKDKQPGFVVPDDVVDLAFRLKCPTLPLDHAHALSEAILGEIPWMADEEQAGMHLIHGAASGNGWFRPEDVEHELLQLSRRTRMRLRLPQHRLDDARSLVGTALDIAGHTLEIGETEIFLLSSLPTLFARYVVADEDMDEEQFLQASARTLEAAGIPCRKMLGGITHSMKFPGGAVFTRSLMVADLEPEQSVRLQQIGLGEGRARGCGLFLPHMGIKPVNGTEGE